MVGTGPLRFSVEAQEAVLVDAADGSESRRIINITDRETSFANDREPTYVDVFLAGPLRMGFPEPGVLVVTARTSCVCAVAFPAISWASPAD